MDYILTGLLGRLAGAFAAAVLGSIAVSAQGVVAPVNERGPVDAPVTVVEYCSYELERCGRLDVIVNAVLRDYTDRVRFVFHYVQADPALPPSLKQRAALAAGVQGRFWDLHGLLMANADRARDRDVYAMAAQLGLDSVRFAHDIAGADIAASAAQDAAEAVASNIAAIPAVLVNGRPSAVASARDLRAAIDAALRR